MHPTGLKIKTIQELKKLSLKDVADKLEMSVSGYSRIERGEVNVNTDKIEKLASIFEVSVPSLMDFDEKMVFSFMNNTNSNNGYVVNSFPEELKKSYESQIALQAKIIGQLELEIAVLKGKY